MSIRCQKKLEGQRASGIPHKATTVSKNTTAIQEVVQTGWNSLQKESRM